MNGLTKTEVKDGTPFEIGTQFKTRGSAPRLCTVTDILKTYNSKGELVKTRYVAEHELMGQTITNHDVCWTTIRMGLVQGAA